MKTEGDLNGEISSWLRKMSPKIHYLKVADKYSLGISDFIIWGDGKNAAVESKFVLIPPGPNVLLLKHPFSGKQITFLESIYLTGNRSWGLVYINETSLFYLIQYTRIPEKGNWKTGAFFKESFKTFTKSQFKDMINHILTGDT